MVDHALKIHHEFIFCRDNCEELNTTVVTTSNMLALCHQARQLATIISAIQLHAPL